MQPKPEIMLYAAISTPAIATIVAAIIGGAWIYYVSNNVIIRHAKAKFISNILTILIDLYPINNTTTTVMFKIIKSSYPALSSAIYEFRFHICKCKVLKYNKTWQNYEKWRNEILQSNSETYNLDKAHEKKLPAEKEFHVHIDLLLKFAKFT